MTQNTQSLQVPVFRPGWDEDIADFAARCSQILQDRPCTGTLPFRVGAAELDADRAKEFIAAQEDIHSDSFGQAVVTLNRAQMRRGRFVTLFPEMEAEGLPCEVLCLDLTDAPALAEDGGELAAVLEFLGRFCQEGAQAWVLAQEAGSVAVALAAALTRSETQ